MKTNLFRHWLLGLWLSLWLIGCSGQAQYEDNVQIEQGPTTVASSVSAGVATGEETAVAFYTWYLDYIGDRSAGNFRNPLVDRAYQDSPYLSEDLVAQVDTLLTNSESGGYDPFLQAQTIPDGFTAQPRPDAEQVMVTFHFLNEQNEPYGEWSVLLSFVEADGRYQINAID